MFINHSSKEVTAKIVFYGPGLSGKTTCLQYIFSVTNANSRGELISIETEIERTLFFDLLPINVGLVKGYQTKFQLYTVPGQVFYDSTRKLVLKGADGVVFVADSQQMMEQQNLESLENLKKNLTAHKLDIKTMPMVFQYNKRDLNNLLPIEKMNKILNPRNHSAYGTIATKGEGVLEALRDISSMILKKIKTLLDHAEEAEQKKTTVEFDINRKHKIIAKENLPLKKIHPDNLQKLDQQVLPKEMLSVPPSSEKEKPEEEILRVETVEEIDDLGDFLMDEEPLAPLPDMNGDKENKEEEIDDVYDLGEFQELEIPELDEFDKDEEKTIPDNKKEPTVDTAEFRQIEEVLDKEKEKEVAKKKNNKEPDEDNEPFKDLDDIQIDMDDDLGATKLEFAMDMDDEIQELDEIGELVEESGKNKNSSLPIKTPETEETREAEPFKLQEKRKSELHSSSPTRPPVMKEKEAGPSQPAKKIPSSPQKETSNKEIREVENYKKNITIEKKNKEIPNKLKQLDIFDQFKDKSRLTIIKAVPVKEKGSDTHLFIDVKDKDSNLLESVKVQVTPEIKKITLILDVKK